MLAIKIVKVEDVKPATNNKRNFYNIDLRKEKTWKEKQ